MLICHVTSREHMFIELGELMGGSPTAFSPLGGPMCPHKKKKTNLWVEAPYE